MTEIAVQQQIDAIKKATEKALKSKESAQKFLSDAGIVKDKAIISDKQGDKKKK